jgi:uncharacterized protein (DUF2236 family)
MSKALTLPAPVQRSIEDFAAGFLVPEGSPAFDFRRPAGEPALVPAESVSWRIFKNPVTMFIGGVAAVLLELAEPRVRHGVWDHSNFRTEPLRRLQRTGLAAMVTIYGPQGAARAMIAAVNRMHARVSGTTSGGINYRADHPELLDWVQATAAFGFLEAYSCYARTLGTAERDLYYFRSRSPRRPVRSDGRSRLAGGSLGPLPPNASQTGAVRHPARIPRHHATDAQRSPAAGRPAQAMLVRAAVDILPHGIADLLRLGPEWRLRSWERPLVKTLARSADRLLLRSSPAVQSCLRLGLAEDHLYK